MIDRVFPPNSAPCVCLRSFPSPLFFSLIKARETMNPVSPVSMCVYASVVVVVDNDVTVPPASSIRHAALLYAVKEKERYQVNVSCRKALRGDVDPPRQLDALASCGKPAQESPSGRAGWGERRDGRSTLLGE